MTTDQFRFNKSSNWKTLAGAIITINLTIFYFYRLTLLQTTVKNGTLDKVSDPKNEGVIAEFTFTETFRIGIRAPGSFTNWLFSLTMALCGLIFMMRQLLCIFVLLPRSISLEELITVYCIFESTIFWSFTTGIEDRIDLEPSTQQCFVMSLGFLIFLSGILIATCSEYQRKSLKVPGRLITEGLWSYSMHINYFGEFMYYLGWAIVTLEWYNLWVPILMLIGFVWVHIPGLDEYLAGRYPDQFPNYAKNTCKLIPYVY